MPPLPASWTLHHTLQLPAREGRTVPIDDLDLAGPAAGYLTAKHPAGVWGHQHAAIAASLRGQDVCVATPTASGKTTVFHAAALHRLATDPAARVIAVYPMKALGREQEARWRAALAKAGIAGEVGRIDGSIPAGARLPVVQASRVLIATPDVLHTWMLPKVGQQGHAAVTKFLRGLALVVVDEAHAYTGVFGSNAAFKFRRLQHVAQTLGAKPVFVAASATMKDPGGHVEALTGRSFTVIGPDDDTSPRHPVAIEMVRPAQGKDYIGALKELLTGLQESAEQFVAFFDSRKSAELTAAVMGGDPHADGDDGFAFLESAAVLPYRAGYEAEHRDVIQRRLSDGTLAGVLSTSALELGLDLPHLKTVVLVGVPSSGTSLMQRIGRVGRSGPGRVIVVDSGSMADELTFEHPDALLGKPLADSSIYLANRRVQYAHAMALARVEGEHDRANAASRGIATPLERSKVSWPDGFVALCALERAGQVPHDLREMKLEAGEQPTHAFMLRDVEPQFEVIQKLGMAQVSLGSLSHSQVMREAYPGAVYYYGGRPFRVQYVHQRQRRIGVTRCPRYTTQPMPVHSRITPSTTVHGGARMGRLLAIEADINLWRAVLGFQERRGPTVESFSYPCASPDAPATYAQPSFARTVFTSGVCLTHPALERPAVDLEAIASLLLEAFLVVVPLERQDVDVDHGSLRGAWGPLKQGQHFLCLFDQASGSLRLTGRLRDPEVLRHVVVAMSEMIADRHEILVGFEAHPIGPATRAAVQALLDDAAQEVEPLDLTFEGSDDSRRPVLLPTSRGTSAARPGEVFEVHTVLVHPTHGLSYRGVWVAPAGARTAVTIPVFSVEPVAGQARLGTYDVETGEIAPA